MGETEKYIKAEDLNRFLTLIVELTGFTLITIGFISTANIDSSQKARTITILAEALIAFIIALVLLSGHFVERPIGTIKWGSSYVTFIFGISFLFMGVLATALEFSGRTVIERSDLEIYSIYAALIFGILSLMPSTRKEFRSIRRFLKRKKQDNSG
ncbi:MAG: hypothetical protein Q6356_011830 [Candidatus Wukongarchaeota archaeon]|nr:hypothetical protein [Candidatus Wukongarchaeota archaeon]